jgi:hypothetical protein
MRLRRLNVELMVKGGIILLAVAVQKQGRSV